MKHIYIHQLDASKTVETTCSIAILMLGLIDKRNARDKSKIFFTFEDNNVCQLSKYVRTFVALTLRVLTYRTA